MTQTLNKNLTCLNQQDFTIFVRELQALLREIQRAIIELQSAQGIDGGGP